jgi:hypothetical protein
LGGGARVLHIHCETAFGTRIGALIAKYIDGNGEIGMGSVGATRKSGLAPVFEEIGRVERRTRHWEGGSQFVIGGRIGFVGE